MPEKKCFKAADNVLSAVFYIPIVEYTMEKGLRIFAQSFIFC
jgi:hypothetical protein